MKKIIATLLIVAAGAVCGFSQSLRTGYFVDNYKFGHTMNASFASDQGYITIPALNTLSFSSFSSLSITNVYFPLANGKTGTFLHPDVSAERALAGIKPVTNAAVDFSFDLMSGGFNVGKTGFLTFDIGVRASLQTAVPKSLFELIKVGSGGGAASYNIRNLSFDESSYLQLALGYSMELGVKGLRLGVKVKPIVGVQSISARISELNVETSPILWRIQDNGYLASTSSFLQFKYDDNGVFSGIRPQMNINVTGAGALFDVGLSYKAPFGLSVSASVADVGFFKTIGSFTQYAEANGEVIYKGVEGIDLMSQNPFENASSQEILDRLKELVNFKKADVPANLKPVLPAMKVYAGIKQSFVKDIMSFGVLYSGIYGQFSKTHEVTLAYNIHPSRVFDFTLSYSFLNIRSSLGFLLNVTPAKGLNVFFGMDYLPLVYTKIPFPVPAEQAIVNASMGLSICLGKPRS